MEEKIEGFKTYRHESNPKEKELHDEFIKEFTSRDMEFLVFGHMNSPSGSRPDDHLTDRERKIVVSTIQWLGSPVGQHFLRERGFCDEAEYKTKLKLTDSKLSCIEGKLDRIPTWIKSFFK